MALVDGWTLMLGTARLLLLFRRISRVKCTSELSLKAGRDRSRQVVEPEPGGEINRAERGVDADSRRRVRDLKVPAYTQAEADRAAGLGVDNKQRGVEDVVKKMDETKV